MTKNKSIGTVSFFHSRFTSVISIALVLFLVGLILLMGMLGNKLSVYVKENMSFSIVLKDGLKDVEVKKMQKNLEALPYIKSTEYISKERAAAELEDELGENPETFLGFNPLQASIEVKLHSQYANPDSLRLIEDKIKSYTSVSELLYRKDMMELVQSNMERIGIILLSLVAILMVISFVLISNTIRLLIYSRRFLIHTMQLVGATAGFIRAPFMRYNVISGLFAAILAICMLTGALYYLQMELAGFIQILDIPTLLIVYGAILLLGILLPMLATAVSVNKYLRMSFDKNKKYVKQRFCLWEREFYTDCRCSRINHHWFYIDERRRFGRCDIQSGNIQYAPYCSRSACNRIRFYRRNSRYIEKQQR